MNIKPSPFPAIFEDKLHGMSNEDRELTGQIASGKRSYELIANPIPGNFDIEHLSKIHEQLFQDISTHAGVVRGYGMRKGLVGFAEPEQIPYLLNTELPKRIESLNQSANDKEKYISGMTDLHSTLDLAHPFREGNGRATRAFMSQLAKKHGYELDFSVIQRKQWVEACIVSIQLADDTLKRQHFEKIVAPSEERFVRSAIVSLSIDKSPVNRQKNVERFKEQGIKQEDLKKAVEFLLKSSQQREVKAAKYLTRIIANDASQSKEVRAWANGLLDVEYGVKITGGQEHSKVAIEKARDAYDHGR